MSYLHVGFCALNRFYESFRLLRLVSAFYLPLGDRYNLPNKVIPTNACECGECRPDYPVCEKLFPKFHDFLFLRRPSF